MKQEISEFWRDFQELKTDLEKLETADDPTYDKILDSLQRIDSNLFFEFCSSPNEFIVSAEGKARLFPLVDEIIERHQKLKIGSCSLSSQVEAFQSLLNGSRQ